METKEPNVIIHGDSQTAEERAKGLYNLFYAELYPLTELRPRIAKQCALLHCDQIINWHKVKGNSIPATNAYIIDYFHEVKKAINNLVNLECEHQWRKLTDCNPVNQTMKCVKCGITG